MGNCCCPLSTPCDHTVDETRGLLNSDSKALSCAEGVEVQDNSLQKPVVEDGKHEGEEAEQEVLTTQPDAVASGPEAHTESSYSSVIQSLHTQHSRPEQAHQSASPESVCVATNAAIPGDNGEVQAEVPDPPQNCPEGPVRTEETAETGVEMTHCLVKMDEEVITVSEVAAVEEMIFQEAPSENTTEVRDEKQQEVSEASGEKEEPEAPEVLVQDDATETKESASKISKTDRHDAEDLQTLTDVAKNADGAEMQSADYSSAKPQEPSSVPVSETDFVEKAVSAQVNAEEPGTEPADGVEDTLQEDMSSTMVEVREDGSPSDAQEHSKQACPDQELSGEPTPQNANSGQPNDLGDVRYEMSVDAALMLAPLQETEKETEMEMETSLTPCEEPLHTGSEAEMQPESSCNINSTAEQVDELESRDTAADQEKITLSIAKEQEVSLLNGLDSFTPAQKPEFTKTPSDTSLQDDTELKCKVTGPSEALSLDEHTQEEAEPEAQPSEQEVEDTSSLVQEVLVEEDTESHKGQKGEIILTSNHAVEVAVIPLPENEICIDTKEQEDEDLYQGAGETGPAPPKETQLTPLLEFTIPGAEESCSLAAVVDILAYSEREWKGNTAKSSLIRKGYSEISCSFSGLRRVRGDNYCALRATLYQVLATTTQTPVWLQGEDFTSLPEKLEVQEHLIGGWRFPVECRNVGEKEDDVEKLKCYMELLQKKWRAAAESCDPEEKQRVCERAFQGGEEEYGLLEALKLLMLARAVDLYEQMQAGQDVPVFCWLLFARDTSENPRTFLTNHLSQVGFGGGVEQVEMFLLGYALQHTIQAFRLYMIDTEEFVTHYPDDHKQDWPCVSIVTEDDRHYNVPVRKPVQHQRNSDITVLLPLTS
ncbi:uncharacterized protein LOC143519128 isoform X2 [Brachyhypopomus gauderio]|uniref:uncharacterized protein LOC143519128 isoform X2 n=1 Tax=Brachyhypopomus gauderio TaxID=698409 RepID=UPI0040425D1E